MYQADDGGLFTSEDLCLKHERVCLHTDEANKLFQEGASLAHALDHYRLGLGFLPETLSDEDCADLKAINKDTQLIISHWQCRDEPGYKPVRIELDGAIFVYGNAGSWSGPYGGKVKLSDLLRYYRDTKRELAARAKRAEGIRA